MRLLQAVSSHPWTAIPGARGAEEFSHRCDPLLSPPPPPHLPRSGEPITPLRTSRSNSALGTAGIQDPDTRRVTTANWNRHRGSHRLFILWEFHRFQYKTSQTSSEMHLIPKRLRTSPGLRARQRVKNPILLWVIETQCLFRFAEKLPPTALSSSPSWVCDVKQKTLDIEQSL